MGIVTKLRRHCYSGNQILVVVCISLLFLMFIVQPNYTDVKLPQTTSSPKQTTSRGELLKAILTKLIPTPISKGKILDTVGKFYPVDITKSVAATESSKTTQKTLNQVTVTTLQSNSTQQKKEIHINYTAGSVNGNASVTNISAVAKPFKFKYCQELNPFVLTQDKVDRICSANYRLKTGCAASCLVDKITEIDTSKFVNAKLETVAGKVLQIFTYSKFETVSAGILSIQKWEHDLVTSLMNIVKKYEKLIFFDIGSNLGVYALNAAALGKTVIAVDANYHNALRLKKSVIENSFDDKVSVFWNAISIKNESFRMTLESGCNVGGSAPITDDVKVDETKYEPDNIRVKPLPLDSFVLDRPEKDAVMKIDVEGQEFQVLRSSSKLFDSMHIHAVMMEWMQTVHDKELTIQFFSLKGYHPHKTDGTTPLAGDPNLWPHDIIWTRSFP